MIAAPFLLTLLLAQDGAAVSLPPDQAVTRLQEAIRRNPEIESNYTDLGNILLRTQNFNEAALILEATHRRFPQSAQAALSLGVAYYGLRRFSDAVGALLEAGALDADAEQPVAFLSRLPENWGERKPEVIALFKKYTARHAGSPIGHLALGIATGDAVELRKAIRLNPRMAEAHFELGAALEKNRDFTGAADAFRRAAELRPKDPNAHYRLSRLYARLGDTTRSEAERALHEKLSAEEKEALDQRQGKTQHLNVTVRP